MANDNSDKSTDKRQKKDKSAVDSTEAAQIHESLKPLSQPISALRPLTGNPRRGNVEAVKKSLQQFGQRKPIVAKRDGEVIAGNHTLQAITELGWPTVAVVYVDDDQATARAFALADNRTSDLGGYDDELLATMLQETLKSGLDLLTATGYQADDVERLLEQINGQPKVDINADPDDIPQPKKPVTKLGDLWQLGEHRLICGDSTIETTYERLLTGVGLVDCVWTDPPYNVNYEGGTHEKLTIANDSMTSEKFREFLKAALSQTKQNMKNGAAIYVSYADGKGADFQIAFAEAGFELRQILIWVKDRFVLSRQDYNWQHEPIMYGWKEGAAHTWNGPFNLSTLLDDESEWATWKKDELLNLLNTIAAQSTVIREQRPARNADHPTAKPVNLITRLITNNTNPKQTILDPFAGSGSTLVAAHITGRVGMMIELDPIYCDVICARYQQLTGTKPINTTAGKQYDFKK